MRYKNLIGFVWVAVIVSLFTSCLKDINNVYNPGTTAAVVRQHGDSALMMANTRFGWIYATKLSSYSEGKCLLVSFDYDPSLPENTGAEEMIKISQDERERYLYLREDSKDIEIFEGL